MKLNYKNILAYASAFTSFVIQKINVEEIILFGSAARKEADKDSDIDLFFNVKNNENETKKILERELKKFYKSYLYEQFSLKEINNPLSIKVGNLEEWKLKRSIINEGVTLYGKYRSLPNNLKGYTLFILKPIKNITKRNRIIRKLYGRKEKNYTSKGRIEKENGKQLSPSSFIIPLEKTHDIINILKKEKIDYSLLEFYSDQKYYQ